MKARRRLPELTSAAALGAALLLAAPTARAQTPTFYLDRLQIGGAPEDGTALWRPRFGPSSAFAQLAFGYSLNPLRASTVAGDEARAAALEGPPVDRQLTAYLSVGAELSERVAVQLTVPFVLDQGGSRTDAPAAGLHQAVRLASAAVMDARLDGRVLFYRSDGGALRLGARGAVFFPVGDERSFAGDTGLWGHVGVAADLDLGPAAVTLNAGPSIRPRTSLHQLAVGTELTFGAGVYVPLLDSRLRLGAELFGSAGLASLRAGELDTPALEWGLGGRWLLGASRSIWVGASAGTRLTDGYAPDLRAVALAGGVLAFPAASAQSVSRSAGVRGSPDDGDHDGLPDLLDACPADPEDHRGDAPEDGCPDTDGDGLPDPEDRCPTAAEDTDGLDDHDGCPEDDADGDGVPDTSDACPTEPGEAGGGVAKSGCPQLVQAIEGETALVLKKEIEFSRDRATIEPSSHALLDQVVRLIQASPELRTVRIEGHTDDTGDPDYNQKLSEDRAAAVRDYLVKQGIDPARVVSRGLGSTRPIAKNDTSEGRAKNRRVEIHLDNRPAEERP